MEEWYNNNRFQKTKEMYCYSFKAITKTVLGKITKIINERQKQRFRKNKSTIDVIFVVKQLYETLLEFTKYVLSP